MLHQARRRGIAPDDQSWAIQRVMLANLERRWHEPDEGIWEVRGPRRHFTHSKVMAWVAFDRGVKAVEEFGRDGAGRPLASAFATRSMRRCSSAATTRSSARSSGTTAGSESTRAC